MSNDKKKHSISLDIKKTEIDENFRPTIFAGLKDLDLLNLSLEKQIEDMTGWSKTLGDIVPLLGKIHEEMKKMRNA